MVLTNVGSGDNGESITPFMDDWAFIAILVIGAVLVVAAALYFLVPYLANRKKKKAKDTKVLAIEGNKDTLLLSLGGRNNVLEHIRNGSRLSLRLADSDLVDVKSLKEAGINNYILTSEKITIVLPGIAADVEASLFPEDM